MWFLVHEWASAVLSCALVEANAKLNQLSQFECCHSLLVLVVHADVDFRCLLPFIRAPHRCIDDAWQGRSGNNLVGWLLDFRRRGQYCFADCFLIPTCLDIQRAVVGHLFAVEMMIFVLSLILQDGLELPHALLHRLVGFFYRVLGHGCLKLRDLSWGGHLAQVLTRGHAVANPPCIYRVRFQSLLLD